MQVRGIGVNTADMMMLERSMQESEIPVQPSENTFGPEYEVTLSEEGKNLSRQLSAQAETGIPGMPGSEVAGVLPDVLEGTVQAGKTRKDYIDELDEIEKQIKVMDAGYGGVDSVAYIEALKKVSAGNRSFMNTYNRERQEILEQQRQLRENMQEQKDMQSEEALKKLEAAQQLAAMQNAMRKGEIDENNRDLVALLRTMEEAEKAEDERENGVSPENEEASEGEKSSASDAIKGAAAGFVKSSFWREQGVEELSDTVEGSGREFISRANNISQTLLKKRALFKEVVSDRSVTIGQIDEMMVSFRHEVDSKCAEATVYGCFGTQVMRDMLDARMQHIADDPLGNMQQTKDAMMQAAVDAALGEARASSIDKTSEELAEEVEKLIDERNHIDRTSSETKEDKTELLQPEVAEKE